MLTLTVFIIHKPLTLDCESRAVNDNHRDRSSSLLLLLVFCLTKSHRSSTWRWRATRSSNWTRIGYGGYKDFKSYVLPKENWKATKSARPHIYCQPKSPKCKQNTQFQASSSVISRKYHRGKSQLQIFRIFNGDSHKYFQYPVSHAMIHFGLCTVNPVSVMQGASIKLQHWQYSYT